MHPGRARDLDFFGTSVMTPGQGSPGCNKLTLRERFPWMTKLDAAWLRMALKLYNGFEPTARELRAAEVSSSWAIKCILALSCKIDWSLLA